MRYSQRRKRNYIIMGLCMVLAVMAVSYAAFSQQLTINSSAGTTTKWCLGFDTTVTGNVSATAGLTGATAPTGTITYDGNTCDGNYNSGASLSSTLHQPGDTLTYTLTIKNSSTIDAAINSITVNNQNTVSDKDVKIGNIVFVVGMPESTSLSAGSSTTMTVTAKFQDETDITGGYNGETASITVNVNASQDGGSGGFEKKFSGYIYRNNNTTVNIGDNIAPFYMLTTDGLYGGSHGPNDKYNSLEECEEGHTSKYGGTSQLSCQYASSEVLVGGGTKVQSEIQSNYTYYLKHKIEDDVVEESYVCFIIQGKERCLKGVDTTSYLSNQNVLREFQALSNLNVVSVPSASNPGCKYSGDSFCYGGGFYQIYVSPDGTVRVNNSSSSLCAVNYTGSSNCPG